MKWRIQGSAVEKSTECVAPEQFIEHVALEMARIPEKIRISHSRKSKNP